MNKKNNLYGTLTSKKISKEYNNIVKETKEYFNNYSEIENKDKEALKLINKYKSIDNKIKLNNMTSITELAVLFILGFITFIMLIFSKRKLKRV